MEKLSFANIRWYVKKIDMTNYQRMACSDCKNPLSLESGENTFDDIDNYTSGKMSPNIVYSVESKENVKKGRSN